MPCDNCVSLRWKQAKAQSVEGRPSQLRNSLVKFNEVSLEREKKRMLKSLRKPMVYT